MLKTILIYEIATDRSVVEYKLDEPEESPELFFFNLAWNKAISEGLVNDKDRRKFALQVINIKPELT